MNSQLVYALLLLVGLTILGCDHTDRTHELPSTAKQATDPPNIPTNATSPKRINQ
jgi:hypothetical protein